jgi:hypothetical protein
MEVGGNHATFPFGGVNFHRFVRDGGVRQYRTAHQLSLRGGQIAAWEELPGCREDFDAAWGGSSQTACART